MLYRLEIENFFSIRDQQVLDVSVAPNVSDPEGRYAPIFEGYELRAPKVLALYGPNASGKTNVLRALDFIIGFARDTSQRTVPGFFCERFNDEASRSRPIRLAIEFGGITDLTPEIAQRAENGEAVEQGLYRYELEIDVVEGAPQRVTNEALRQKPGGKGKWKRVFERNGEGEVEGSKSFPITGYRHLLNTLRPNVSVVSSFAMFQHTTAQLFHEAAARVVTNMHMAADDRLIGNVLASDPALVDLLNRDVRRIDVGVEGIRIQTTPDGPIPMFRHEGLELEMPWMLESHGTRAFIKVFPLLAATLGQGGIAIIDEFDNLIHPLILPELMRWFYDKEERNSLDAQIWLSCHSASLLDDLTKEEVILCEKDRLGRTRAFSLMDMKAVRRDDNLYRKYLSGVYGAVPQIG